MQILAWNGGGSSNYSDIIGKGGYAADKKKSYTVTIPDMEFTVPDAEEVRELLESAGHKVHGGPRKLQSKIEKLTEEIEDFVEEEIKEFFADLE